MIGAFESASGSPCGPGGQRLPTLTDLLYQLATGSVTSERLVRCSLHAIDVSQPTLNAFRVVLTESALADAKEADKLAASIEDALFGELEPAVREQFANTMRAALGRAQRDR